MAVERWSCELHGEEERSLGNNILLLSSVIGTIIVIIIIITTATVNESINEARRSAA